MLLLECRRGAHLPFLGHEPVGGNTTIVCDAWPVRRQTFPSDAGTKLLLLGDNVRG